MGMMEMLMMEDGVMVRIKQFDGFEYSNNPSMEKVKGIQNVLWKWHLSFQQTDHKGMVHH